MTSRPALILAVLAAIAGLAGCCGVSTPERPALGVVGNEAERLMSRKDYAGAVANYPEFVGDALTTIVELQRRIHQEQP